MDWLFLTLFVLMDGDERTEPTRSEIDEKVISKIPSGLHFSKNKIMGTSLVMGAC